MNERLIRRLFPQASQSLLEANADRLPDTEPQPDAGQALDSPATPEERGAGRVVVRFTRYCVRPIDTDNAIGGTKALCDALRYAGLIQGDEPWRIKLEFEQRKAATFADEKTEVELIYPYVR